MATYHVRSNNQWVQISKNLGSGGGPTVPDAPTNVTAVAGDTAAVVSWSTPVNNGGSGITSYTVTGNPASSFATVDDGDTNATVALWKWTFSTGWTRNSSSGDTYCGTSGRTATVRIKSFANGVVNLYGVTDAHHSMVSVSIDGGATQLIDGYSSSRKDDVNLWTSPQLTAGEHTLVFTTLTQANSEQTPSGIMFVIDRLDVTGADNGGNPPVSKTVAAPASTTQITGLVNNVAYTFTVSASNDTGSSPLSAASTAVTPVLNSGNNGGETGISVGSLAITVSNTNVTASWNVTVNDPVTFKFMQVAVRTAASPNATTGPDFAFNNNATVASVSAFNGTTSLAAGSYVARVAYNITGLAGDWVSGQSVSFTTTGTVTPNPVGRKVPLIGRSGLPWNAGVFYGNGDIAKATTFGNWRSRPVDTSMTFVGRSNWNDMMWLRDDFTSFPGLRIIALPTQPTNMDNSSTAAGSNNAWWENYGQALTNKGWNDGRTVLRLNWEFNLGGNPYAGNKPNAAAFRDAFRNVVRSVRKTAPNTLFDWCMNRGPDQMGGVKWSDTYPGDDFVDVVGLDWYDQYPAIFNQTNYNSAYNLEPAAGQLIPFCRAHGKMLSLDEWGVSHWVGAGGNDNPYYIQKMWEFFNANSDLIAWENTYNDAGAPSTLNHVLYPRNSGNPNASDRYLQLWGG